MIYFDVHWQTRVYLEEDYRVYEGSGNHVTWGTFGGKDDLRELGGLVPFEGLLSERLDFTFVSTGRLRCGVIF